MLKDLMENLHKYDAFRCFTDSEAKAIFPKIANSYPLQQLVKYVYPQYTQKDIENLLNSVKGIEDFVAQISYKAIKKIVDTKCDGATFSGFDDKPFKDKAFVLFSNHRDIALDSTIMNMHLHELGYPITQSAIGDNLVEDKNILDIAKINRNFLVFRKLSPREMLESSHLLSEYIYRTITEDKQCVWLAQKEGRTKDGNDQTHSGVLKMLSMASDKSNLVEHLKSLNIVPMAVSYEYDPTAILKLPQILAQENDIKYVKKPGEDLESILTGALGYKGRVHISWGDVLDKELEQLHDIQRPAQQLRRLAEIIDDKIHKIYKLFPSNYVAHDIKYNTDKYKQNYTQNDIEKFNKIVLEPVEKDNPRKTELVLDMYANPVINKFK